MFADDYVEMTMQTRQSLHGRKELVLFAIQWNLTIKVTHGTGQQ